MATPHIAGLLGYLLSIYGSETFLPAQATLFDLKEPAKQSFTSKIVSLLLPSYASTVVSELFSITAPVPPKKKTLTPAELKKALIKLGSVGLISGELPEGTPNMYAAV
jgi:cerevisin